MASKPRISFYLKKLKTSHLSKMSITKALNNIVADSMLKLGEALAEKFDLDQQEVAQFVAEWNSGKLKGGVKGQKSHRLTGYNLFCRENNKHVREQFSKKKNWDGMDNKEKLSQVSKKLGTMWKTLAKEEKDEYNTNAKSQSPSRQTSPKKQAPKKQAQKKRSKSPQRKTPTFQFDDEKDLWFMKGTKIVVKDEETKKIKGRYMEKTKKINPLTVAQYEKYKEEYEMSKKAVPEKLREELELSATQESQELGQDSGDLGMTVPDGNISDPDFSIKSDDEEEMCSQCEKKGAPHTCPDCNLPLCDDCECDCD